MEKDNVLGAHWDELIKKDIARRQYLEARGRSHEIPRPEHVHGQLLIAYSAAITQFNEKIDAEMRALL